MKCNNSRQAFCESVLETSMLPVGTLHQTINNLLDGTSAYDSMKCIAQLYFCNASIHILFLYLSGSAKEAIDRSKNAIQKLVTSETNAIHANIDEMPWSFQRFAMLKNPRQKLLEVYTE